MNEINALHDRNPDPAGYDAFETEEDATAAFDERVARCLPTKSRDGVFERSFAEVRGFYLAHRPGREQKQARIDRVLLPGKLLRERGWTMTIGIEIKRSGCDFGAAVSQAIDYTYCTWNVGAYWMYCERIFLWPFTMPHGPLQSVMLQNGIGVVRGRLGRYGNPALSFQLERNNIVITADGTLEECAATNGGSKKGSR